MRPAKQGDSVILDGRSALIVDWTTRVPVEVTVTSPAGGVVAGLRLEPRASTEHYEAAPLRSEISLPLVHDRKGGTASGKVDYAPQNGAPVSGVSVGLVSR